MLSLTWQKECMGLWFLSLFEKTWIVKTHKIVHNTIHRAEFSCTCGMWIEGPKEESLAFYIFFLFCFFLLTYPAPPKKYNGEIYRQWSCQPSLILSTIYYSFTIHLFVCAWSRRHLDTCKFKLLFLFLSENFQTVRNVLCVNIGIRQGEMGNYAIANDCQKFLIWWKKLFLPKISILLK